MNLFIAFKIDRNWIKNCKNKTIVANLRIHVLEPEG